MSTSATPHLLWITSRAAGIVALVAASLAVSVGLLVGAKLLRKQGPELRAAHEALSLTAIVAVVVHGVALLGDGFLHPSIADITVPFVSSYRTFWTTLGIISGWGLILLGLSYYARRLIGPARWRKLHRFTALLWIVGLAHSLGEGTDAGQAWFLAMTALVAVPALALLATRLLRARRAAGPSGPPADDSRTSPADDSRTPPADDSRTSPADDSRTPPADDSRTSPAADSPARPLWGPPAVQQ